MAYIGAEPVPGQNREIDDISSGFNGSATAFTLQVSSTNVSPESANNILVNLGGVMQNPSTDYTIAASTITFTTAPASGLSFWALILGAGINTATVADQTIGPSKLLNTAVTAGSYTTADITVDAQGRVTAAASGTISGAEIADQAVTNAKVNNSAAIDVSKLSGVMPLAGGTFTDDVTFQCASGSIIFDKSANDLTFSDSVKARFGDSNDLTIFHDGSNSHIEEAGTGSLLIKSDAVNLGSVSGEYYFRGFLDGSASLRFDNSTKLETDASGINVTGDIDVTNKVALIDNGKLICGVGDDLQILHNGSANIIDCEGGNTLKITSDISGNNETMANFVPNGAVELYFDNEKVFQTTATGIRVDNTNGNGEIRVRGSEGNGAQIYMDADDADDNEDQWRLDVAASDGSFGIQNFGDGSFEKNIECNHGGNVELYFDNVKQIETTTLGLQIRDHHKFMTGTVTQRVWQAGSGVCIRPNVAAAGGNNTQGTFIRASANCSNIDDDDTVKFVVFGTGDTQNANNSYAGFSDVNLKQDIVDAGSQWDDIKNLKVRKYRFKNNPTGPLQIGCIAQEVETVSAGLIDTDPEEGFKSLKYSVLYMKAIKCLQEAITKIETLETKVAALEAA